MQLVYMVSRSLVPRRSLLIRCPHEVWERGRVSLGTSQVMVESRNDRAENAWGLGWVSRYSDGVFMLVDKMSIVVPVVAPRLLVNETPSLHCSGNREVNF